MNFWEELKEKFQRLYISHFSHLQWLYGYLSSCIFNISVYLNGLRLE